MWATAVGDDKLGLVYLPIANASVDYVGSHRTELEKKYADSLVAVDVTTGRDVWHFQALRHDLWDYDLGSQPTLMDYPGADGLPVARSKIYMSPCLVGSRMAATFLPSAPG